MLTLLFVHITDAAGGGPRTAFVLGELYRTALIDGMRLLESARNASETPTALTRTELGSPARRLVEVAERRAARFIVIGRARRRHLLARLIEGVGDQVIRTAPCPVVVVPVD